MRFPAALLCAATALAQVPMPPPQVPSAPKPAATVPPRAAAPKIVASPPYKSLTFPARRAPQFPAVKRFQLPNGLKLLLAEDHENPLIYGAALVRTGSLFDPPGKAGLATLTGALLRGGGIGDHTPESLDAELERLGGSIDAGAGDTMATVSMVGWKPNLTATLSLFQAVLTSPAFRTDRLDLVKSSMFDGIARRNSDAQQVARREFLTLLQRKEPPGHQGPEYATVSAIQRGDLVRFYEQYYVPSNTILVFSGDFDTEAMRGALEALFSAWKPGAQATADFAPGTDGPGGAYLASIPETRQTALVFGRAGLTYRDADAAAMEVAAKLVEIRLRRRTGALSDYARELRAEAAPGLIRPGGFILAGAFPSVRGADSIPAAIEELQKLRAGETSDEELRAAREAVWNRVCEGLDKKSNAAVAIATAESYGLPADYLSKYLQAVENVTRADLARVAKERLDPARFTLVAASDARAFVDPRTSTAATPIDLRVAARPPASPALSGSSQEAGKLLARAQRASGGAEKLAAVKDMTVKTVYALASGGKQEQLDQWIAPSLLRQEATSPRFGKVIRFTDGTSGWISNGYNSGPLIGPAGRQAIGEAGRHPISLLLSDRMPDRVLRSLDEESIEIIQGELLTRVVFDRATGLPSEASYEIPTERQPVLMREVYSDYRDVNGIKLPFHVVTSENGQKYGDGAVVEIKLNQGLKPEVLQKRP